MNNERVILLQTTVPDNRFFSIPYGISYMIIATRHYNDGQVPIADYYKQYTTSTIFSFPSSIAVGETIYIYIHKYNDKVIHL